MNLEFRIAAIRADLESRGYPVQSVAEQNFGSEVGCAFGAQGGRPGEAFVLRAGAATADAFAYAYDTFKRTPSKRSARWNKR